MFRLPSACLAALLLTSCLVVPEDATPQVNAAVDVLSQYNFRGMTNNENGVMQAEMGIDLPTKLETGTLSFKGWANYDLSDDVGDAWFPDGHGGEPSEFDFHASYTEHYRGFDVTTGFVEYALQNPDDFPFAAERGETKEIFVEVAREVVWALVPSLAMHYDFDEIEGWYFNAAVAREFPINEKWIADASVSLGYSDEEQSEWTYGLPEAGLADLRGTGRISYVLDTHTMLTSSLNVSTILDSELQDWLDSIGIDSNTWWASVGVNWSY